MLGHELGVLAQAVARTFDLDDHGMMQEPVEERGGDDRIAEDLAPMPAPCDDPAPRGAGYGLSSTG